MPTAMQYGSGNYGKDSNRMANFSYVSGGVLVGGVDSKILEFDAGGIYVLFTGEWNSSTEAYRGHHLSIIKVPELSLYGTTAIQRGSAYASSNSGVTFTANNDSTLTIAPTNANYSVRYALYKVGI